MTNRFDFDFSVIEAAKEAANKHLGEEYKIRENRFFWSWLDAADLDGYKYENLKEQIAKIKLEMTDEEIVCCFRNLIHFRQIIQSKLLISEIPDGCFNYVGNDLVKQIDILLDYLKSKANDHEKCNLKAYALFNEQKDLLEEALEETNKAILAIVKELEAAEKLALEMAFKITLDDYGQDTEYLKARHQAFQDAAYALLLESEQLRLAHLENLNSFKDNLEFLLQKDAIKSTEYLETRRTALDNLCVVHKSDLCSEKLKTKLIYAKDLIIESVPADKETEGVLRKHGNYEHTRELTQKAISYFDRKIKTINNKISFVEKVLAECDEQGEVNRFGKKLIERYEQERDLIKSKSNFPEKFNEIIKTLAQNNEIANENNEKNNLLIASNKIKTLTEHYAKISDFIEKNKANLSFDETVLLEGVQVDILKDISFEISPIPQKFRKKTEIDPLIAILGFSFIALFAGVNVAADNFDSINSLFDALSLFFHIPHLLPLIIPLLVIIPSLYALSKFELGFIAEGFGLSKFFKTAQLVDFYQQQLDENKASLDKLSDAIAKCADPKELSHLEETFKQLKLIKNTINDKQKTMETFQKGHTSAWSTFFKATLVPTVCVGVAAGTFFGVSFLIMKILVVASFGALLATPAGAAIFVFCLALGAIAFAVAYNTTGQTMMKGIDDQFGKPHDAIDKFKEDPNYEASERITNLELRLKKIELGLENVDDSKLAEMEDLIKGISKLLDDKKTSDLTVPKEPSDASSDESKTNTEDSQAESAEGKKVNSPTFNVRFNVLKDKIADFKKAYEELKTINAELTNTIKEKEITIASLEVTVQEQGETIKTHEKTIADQKEELDSKTQEISRLQEQVELLKSTNPVDMPNSAVRDQSDRSKTVVQALIDLNFCSQSSKAVGIKEQSPDSVNSANDSQVEEVKEVFNH